MPTLTLHITVSEDAYAQLKADGQSQHRTVTGQAEYMVEQWLKRFFKSPANASITGQRSKRQTAPVIPDGDTR